jgi:hypothetical protein
LVKIHA